MRIAMRPRSPTTSRTTLECEPCTGMKSTNVAAPSLHSKRVSKISVLCRYCRVTRARSSRGEICQRPCSSEPSNAAKQASESKRGQHSQSIEPSRPTNAAASQSPISA